MLTVLVLVGIACLADAGRALAAGDANEITCPSETESSPGFRGYLPDCRAFEMMTPPYEGGQPALWSFSDPVPVSTDGEHLLGIDFAGFAGSENDEDNGLEYGAIYEFSRTSSGWSTEALEPPASLSARRKFDGASADLSRTLWSLDLQSQPGEEVTEPDAYTFALREAVPGGPARFTEVGPAMPAPDVEPGYEGNHQLRLTGASRDLTHIVAGTYSSAGQLWPGDTTLEGQRPSELEKHAKEVKEEHEGHEQAKALPRSEYESLYEYVGTGNAEPTLVGVSNEGPLTGTHVNEHAQLISDCGTALGSAGSEAGDGSAYNAISANGSIVYFTALHGTVLRDQCATPAVNELYARVDQSHTVAISEPAMTAQRETECTGVCREDENEEDKRGAARFEGASEDGSKIFFTTAQPLLNGDTDTTNDLYEAEVGEAGVTRLVQVSRGEGPTPGAGAEVVAVARISADGSHVYYVAKGVLTNGQAQTGEKAEAGAYNLYVYDTVTETTSFVANLMTRAEVQAQSTNVESEREAKEKAYPEEIEHLAERIEEEEEEEEFEEVEELEIRKTKVEEELAELPAVISNKLAEEGKERTGITPHDDTRPFETTPDGDFLVFVNPRDLTGPEDTSTVDQVFEYHAQTQTLVRVSVGQCPRASKTCAAGERFNGDGNTTSGADAASIRYPEYSSNMQATEPASALSLSEDGQVVFRSDDALAPGAAQGSENVYEYREGGVYLVSPGGEAAPLNTNAPRLLGTDESGQDVFFFTTDPLVPQDTDTQADWYDARADGGFPAPPSTAGCTGEGCQGPLGATPAQPAAGGSETTAAGDDLPPAAPKPATIAEPRPPTRAQQLSKALKACGKKPKGKRAVCERRARKRYGAKAGRARSTLKSRSRKGVR